MYELRYDGLKNEIIEIDHNGNSDVIANDFPTEPIFSPNNKKAIFIDPLEWEVLGSLYLYNLEDGTLNKIIQPDSDKNIPKYADWIDDQNIAVVIGLGLGTVAVGGDVYIYNIPNDSLKPKTDYTPKVQITKIIINNETLELSGIEYTDENLNHFKKYENTIAL